MEKMIHKGTLSEHSAIKSEACEFRYCPLCNGWFYRQPEQAPKVPYVEVDTETAYGSTQKMQRSIRVF